MSALARERSVARARRAERGRGPRAGVRRRGEEVAGGQTVLCEIGGEPTLDALVSGAWEGLAARTAVSCPWCGGELTPSFGAHARPIGARCGSCETTLS